jgi:CheY-like chemotaxis protein
VEDDVTFAQILLDMAHDRGLKAVVALQGGSAVSLAREFKPGAITLDIGLPDMGGWTLLDRFKHNPETRHIPVHVISGDDNKRRGLALGAMTYLEKSLGRDSLVDTFGVIRGSVERKVKELLIVMEPGARRERVAALVDGEDLEIVFAATGAEALAAVGRSQRDCVILDCSLADAPATRLLGEMQRLMQPKRAPMVVYCDRELSESEFRELNDASRIGPVRIARSADRLLDETTLLLHRNEAGMTDTQRQILEGVRLSDSTLANRKALVVDDDLRNIFALTSVLEHHDLKVVHAENGRAGIDLLRKTPDVDIVLMDIMMPEMDGYETMRAIRAIPMFRNLPIIALTAKAMKGDRDKCIEAGASDYIAKPVDLEQLFAVLRVWIARGHEYNQEALRGVGVEA